MKDKLLHISRDTPLYLWLLPIFFSWHGFVEFYNLVPLKDAALLAVFYLAVAAGLFIPLWMLLTNIRKAAFAVFLLLCFQFFFGPLQDALKNFFPGSFISGYAFLLPCSLIGLTLTIILLKKNKKNFILLTQYLNILLFALLMTDGALLFLKKRQPYNVPALQMPVTLCPNCPRPDIYLLIADGYPGKIALNDLLQFDNAAFESALRKRGFQILDSSYSNYNYTGYSIASMLQMNYLPGISGNNRDKKDILTYTQSIRKNNFSRFLQHFGYHIVNHSIFDLEGNPSPAVPTFLPLRTRLLTAHTFTSRIYKDLGYHLITTLRIPAAIKKNKLADYRNNMKLTARTIRVAGQQTIRPRFVYTHLMMPHHPFYFDSSGNALPLSMITDKYYFDDQLFISYLKYSNKELLQLVDEIIRQSPEPPVILLMGDHGRREFSRPVSEKYFFSNFNALLLPDGEYKDFVPVRSTVNHLRILVNNIFRQRLPLLPDSTILITE